MALSRVVSEIFNVAEVVHVTLDSEADFKFKRSKVHLLGVGEYCGCLPHSLLELFFTTHRIQTFLQLLLLSGN